MGIKKIFYENDIIIFGAGLNGVKFAYQNESRVMHFVDNKSKLSKIKNWDICRPVRENLNGPIVVAATTQGYVQIAMQLIELGLVEFEDFIFYKWLNKKIAIFHGNCQMEVIKNVLLESRSFNEVFSVYQIPMIHVNKAKFINEFALKACDLFVHHEISVNNKHSYYLSDEYILQNLNQDADRITVPNLNGLGRAFFPSLFRPNINNRPIGNSDGANQYGLFPAADEVILKGIGAGWSVEEIIEHIKSDNVFDKGAIIDNFNEQITYYKGREKAWDIKIIDYILEHYKKEKMFYDLAHPTGIVMNKIISGILDRLGLESADMLCDDELSTKYNMQDFETVIYPAVKRALELEYDTEYVRTKSTGKKLKEEMDIEEYVKEYVWWCGDKDGDDALS